MYFIKQIDYHSISSRFKHRSGAGYGGVPSPHGDRDLSPTGRKHHTHPFSVRLNIAGRGLRTGLLWHAERIFRSPAPLSDAR